MIEIIIKLNITYSFIVLVIDLAKLCYGPCEPQKSISMCAIVGNQLITTYIYFVSLIFHLSKLNICVYLL